MILLNEEWYGDVIKYLFFGGIGLTVFFACLIYLIGKIVEKVLKIPERQAEAKNEYDSFPPAI